jgi:hypothetical protein
MACEAALLVCRIENNIRSNQARVEAIRKTTPNSNQIKHKNTLTTPKRSPVARVGIV